MHLFAHGVGAGLFTTCDYSLQGCIQAGLYAVFVSDWIKVFPRERFIFLKADDVKTNMKDSLEDLFEFMPIGKSVSLFDCHDVTRELDCEKKNWNHSKILKSNICIEVQISSIQCSNIKYR